MAMPSSGCIAIISSPQTCGSIRTAVTSSSSGSLATLSVAAGKAAPHGMREFYGYAGSSASISLSTTDSDIVSQSQLFINTITASAPWNTLVSDPSNLLNTWTNSGSGSQKVTAQAAGLLPMYPAMASITFSIVATPSTNVTWTFYWEMI